MPVEKHTGDELMSGSVNGQTAIEVVAVATAADSQYQQIVELVAEAAASRAPVVRLADRYAVPFTLFSLALAGLAWWLSGDSVRFAEVLVLATPCPLLIAAPVAFLGGMSRAARNGVIVKGGSVLELLAATRTAVFDKTGTLTHGTPALVEIRTESGFTPDELLAAVASAEQYSSHVLAASLIAAARERGLPLVEAQWAQEEATNGIRANIDGREVVVGKFAFVVSAAPAAVRTAIVPGLLAVYAAIDGRYAGALLASDRLRENARATIERLDRLGRAPHDDRSPATRRRRQTTSPARSASPRSGPSACPPPRWTRSARSPNAPWSWSATASTTRPHWRPPKSASPWARRARPRRASQQTR